MSCSVSTERDGGLGFAFGSEHLVRRNRNYLHVVLASSQPPRLLGSSTFYDPVDRSIFCARFCCSRLFSHKQRYNELPRRVAGKNWQSVFV